MVVNDGSTDGTSAIAHDYASRYPRAFRVIDKANRHYGSCVNRGLQEATGAYVKVLDADDSVDTAAFGCLLRCIADETQRGASRVDLFASEYVEVNMKGQEMRRSEYNLPQDVPFGLDAAPESMNRFAIRAICYRTDLLRQIGYRQTEGIAYTDTEWIIEPMAYVRMARYLPKAVTRYLIGRQGQSVESKIFARDFHHVMHITKGLLARYPETLANACPTSRTYYQRQIGKIIKDVYYHTLIGYRGYPVSGDLAEFDAFVQTVPELERDFGGVTAGTKHCQIRMIETYREGMATWAAARRRMRVALVLACIKRYAFKSCHWLMKGLHR